MRYTLLIFCLPFVGFSQEPSEANIDSVLVKMSESIESYEAINSLGICRCLEFQNDTNSVNGYPRLFQSNYAEMYNQFYPVVRFINKDSLVNFLDNMLTERIHEVKEKMRERNEKFNATQSEYLICSRVFNAEVNQYIYGFLNAIENYSSYVLSNGRYFEMYLKNDLYGY